MKTITCRFHGWCFDLKGRCTKIKEEKVGWPSGVEKNKFNLKSLARVKNYKGFIYVSLEKPPQELEDFLGEAKYFIDLLAEQSPLGMEIVPGTQSYMVQGNWKLQAENGVDVTMFPQFTEFLLELWLKESLLKSLVICVRRRLPE